MKSLVLDERGLRWEWTATPTSTKHLSYADEAVALADEIEITTGCTEVEAMFEAARLIDGLLEYARVWDHDGVGGLK